MRVVATASVGLARDIDTGVVMGGVEVGKVDDGEVVVDI